MIADRPARGAPGVVLDIDGTLIDSAYQHALAWHLAFREQGVAVPVWRAHRHVGMGADQLVPAVAGDRAERRVGDAVRAGHDRLFAAALWTTSPLAGARELLLALHDAGTPVALASSAGSREVHHHVRTLRAEPLVAGWTTAADAARTKPHPDLVCAALDLLGTTDAVMVGDSPWDVMAAARAGIPTVGVLTGGFSSAELRRAGAVQVAESVADLVPGAAALSSAAARR